MSPTGPADFVSTAESRQTCSFCPMPYFDRKTENQFLVRTLLALAQTDATILCLLADWRTLSGRIECETSGRRTRRPGDVH